MNVQVVEAQKCFEGVTFQAPTEDMFHRNDFLLPIIGGHFLEVKNTRLPLDRRDHYTMRFMMENMERLGQLAILSGAIVDNLAEADPDSTCLLKPPDQAFLKEALSPEFIDCQGGYLFWDKRKEVYRRSGKVGGKRKMRSYGKREGEHKKGSLLEDPGNMDSFLYMLYADKDIEGMEGMRQLGGGTFQDLTMYVSWALSDYGDSQVGNTDGGIFHWSEEVISGLTKSKAGGGSLRMKQREMVIYAVEFFFGLLISPYYNLSINPGFEAFIGVNNHQKDDDIMCVAV
jgi:hypothetical protein